MEQIISIVKNQINGMTNLDFYKYWLDNFIVKNKETGKEIMIYFRVKDLDSLFNKLSS